MRCSSTGGWTTSGTRPYASETRDAVWFEVRHYGPRVLHQMGLKAAELFQLRVGEHVPLPRHALRLPEEACRGVEVQSGISGPTSEHEPGVVVQHQSWSSRPQSARLLPDRAKPFPVRLRAVPCESRQHTIPRRFARRQPDDRHLEPAGFPQHGQHPLSTAVRKQHVLEQPRPHSVWQRTRRISHQWASTRTNRK